MNTGVTQWEDPNVVEDPEVTNRKRKHSEESKPSKSQRTGDEEEEEEDEEGGEDEEGESSVAKVPEYEFPRGSSPVHEFSKEGGLLAPWSSVDESETVLDKNLASSDDENVGANAPVKEVADEDDTDDSEEEVDKVWERKLDTSQFDTPVEPVAFKKAGKKKRNFRSRS